MENKRSKGVTIFAILLIVSALVGLAAVLDPETIKEQYRSLPESIVTIRYYISIIVVIGALVSGIGLFSLKNIFRKLTILVCSFGLYGYIIELPFILLKSIPSLIEKKALEIVATTPGIPAEVHIKGLWVAIITFWTIDFLFLFCLLFYLTRPKVKEQFK